jgi:hypothetical protein
VMMEQAPSQRTDLVKYQHRLEERKESAAIRDDAGSPSSG